MVRLAQDFALRYPLVEGQGNFGNIDGDNAAAERYTEARLTRAAMALMEGSTRARSISVPTYNGEEEEPVVLPAAVPQPARQRRQRHRRRHGDQHPAPQCGRAVSGACMAARASGGRAGTDAAELCRFVQGPDLPTGGILIEDQATIAEAYRTGRGALRLRARWEREPWLTGSIRSSSPRSPGRSRNPASSSGSPSFCQLKKLPLLGDLRDEFSDTVRLVLVPKARTVPPELLMESLFRTSDLEVRLSLNMNVLDRTGVPRVMGLAELLSSFLDHRMEVLVRRSRFRLTKIADRLEVVQGYLKAFLDIDRVIKIIREEDEPRPVLMAAFELTERQAEAILNLRLRNLRRLEEMELKKEERALGKEQRELQALLADQGKRRARLKEEMLAGEAAFGSGPLGDRRTTLEAAPTVEPQLLEVPVERFPVTVLLSAKGWIRAVRGHLEDKAEIKYKEGDSERFVLKAQSDRQAPGLRE